MKNEVKEGFTLIEALITMAIFSIVIGASHQIFVAGQRTWDRDLSLLDLQQSTRPGFYSVVREIRSAGLASMVMGNGCDHLTAPENCDQVTFDTPSENNIQFLYNSTGNQLIRQDSSANQRILANNITGVYFCCAHGDGNCSCNATYNILEVRLQSEKSVWGRTLNFPLSTKLKVRND